MKSEQTSHSRTAHPRIAGSAWLLSAVLAVVVPTAGWAQTYTRTEVTTYHDNTSLWVMGQVKKVTNADTGVVLSQTEYDTATALPVTFYGPGTGAVQGKVQQTITYDAGKPYLVVDGNNKTTKFTNWMLGIPRFATFPVTPESPAGAQQTAIIDTTTGRLMSSVDELGEITRYRHDSMGRLKLIEFPPDSDGSPIWNDWNAYFRPLTATDWKPPGVATGQWHRVEWKGHDRKITYYDGRWRPVLQHVYDDTNTAGTRSSVSTVYDASGRVVFQSYPSSDIIPPALGTWTTYDALGRVLTVKQDSELGQLTTSTQYLTGFKTRVTNPRGLQVENEYQVYDQPSFDLLRKSVQPEGKVIEIVRHGNLGDPLQIIQRNSDGSVQQTRQYVYDVYRQLCKTIEPETGATVVDYDGNGNVSWSVSGLQGYGDPTACNREQALATGLRVNRTYDGRNRLATLTFPDGRGNQVWTYKPNSLPSTITTYNGAGRTAAVVNAYTYNNRGMLTGESIAQPGAYTWSIGYGYDVNGSLATQTYPSGLVVNYAPNALGQATQAGTYASGVQYYPNGAIKQFSYGNGLTHNMTQNARQLPAQVVDSGNALNHQYSYDPNANVTAILDNVIGTPTAQNRSMTYDGLDRLVTASSAMFGGSDQTHCFTYDVLDNLKSWKLAGVKDYAQYLYSNNRLTSIKDTAGATIVGLDYDAQGNLANKNGQLYAFDYGNRLRDVTGKESYRYDGLGRRVQTIRIDGTQALWQYSQAGQMLFSVDGPTNQKSHENVYLGGSLVAIVDHEWPSNTVIATKYQHTDALGSPVAVSNPAGTVIDRTNYESFGAAINKPDYSGIGYTGHVMDGATELTYMQQRYYDPGIGRFMSVDPVTANASTGANFNRYWYANNNPYRFTDPDGRAAIITRMKDGSIRVDIPTKFKGTGASESNISTLKNDVAALSGTYKVDGKETQVNFRVTEITKSTPRAARNTVTLTDGATSRKDGLSNAQLGGRKAEIDINDRFVKNGTGVHEVLHLADVDDKYDTATRKPDPAWGKNIMNVVPGVLEDRNMPELMNSKKNIYKNEGEK